MNLIIFGPPGAGKGTYTSRMMDLLKIVGITTGDVFRQEIRLNTVLGKKIADFVKKGELVPDKTVNEILLKKIKESKSKNGFILDGYPRTIGQAKALEKVTKIDAIFRLIVPEWIIMERLSNRRICGNCNEIYNIRYLKPINEDVCDKCGGRLFQREDDKVKVIKERLKLYEKQTQPLIDYYQSKGVLVNIDGDAPEEAVTERILSIL